MYDNNNFLIVYSFNNSLSNKYPYTVLAMLEKTSRNYDV